MYRPLEYVRLSGDVRRLVSELARIGDALVELCDGQLAANALDLEIKLHQLHLEVLNRSATPGRPPAREHSAHCPEQLDIPF